VSIDLEGAFLPACLPTASQRYRLLLAVKTARNYRQASDKPNISTREGKRKKKKMPES
jgi:hypothetical protein